MSSKFKVALTKLSHLPLFEKLALKHSAVDPKAVAKRFYLKTLPRMMTMPKAVGSVPTVNLWLWVIGYLRLQWPKVKESRKLLERTPDAKAELILRELEKYLPKKLTAFKEKAQRLTISSSENGQGLKIGKANRRDLNLAHLQHVQQFRGSLEHKAKSKYRSAYRSPAFKN